MPVALMMEPMPYVTSVATSPPITFRTTAPVGPQRSEHRDDRDPPDVTATCTFMPG
jgi:hypothetical protein